MALGSSYTFLLVICLTWSIKATTRTGDVVRLRGSEIQLPCIPEYQQQEIDLLDMATDYKWTDAHGTDLVDSRFAKNDAGDLRIEDLHVADSGTYKCKVTAPASSSEESTTTKVFRHKLIVYELAGHMYITNVTFHLSRKQKQEGFQSQLEDLLANVICAQRDLCQPGKVTLAKCKDFEEGRACNYSLSYKAMNLQADEKCDEKCLEVTIADNLNKARENLKLKLAQFAKNPNSELMPDLESIRSRAFITCDPGFHILIAHHKKCYPCHPGSYSGPNARKCKLCEIGYYQEQYGKHTCNACPEGKSTDGMGSGSKDDCLEPNSGVLENIKSGFWSIFGK